MGGDETEHENLIRRVRLTAIFGLASALLALATGGVTLLFDLKPEWKPDPKENVGATIAVEAFDRNVTQRAYLSRLAARPVGCSREQLDRKGNVFYIDAEIHGFKRQKTSLRWFTYNADNDERLRYQRSLVKESTIFKPQAPINQQLAEVWVPTPRQNGKFYVRFQLYNAAVLLAFVDTEPFPVRVSPFESTARPCSLYEVTRG